MDVGAGTEGCVAAFKRLGVRAAGVEFAGFGRFLARLQGVRLEPFDCTEAPREGSGEFDLVYSIEFGEHIPAQHADAFVRFICSHSPLVVFSAAHPGHGGQGHINEQPKAYWIAQFADHGFLPDPESSEALSGNLTAQGFKVWLPVNLMVFRKSG